MFVEFNHAQIEPPRFIIVGHFPTIATTHNLILQIVAGETAVAADIPAVRGQNSLIDISRYFSRDTYRDIIFYNHDLLFCYLYFFFFKVFFSTMILI